MSQGQRKNKYPVLKVPLDLSSPVDAEVHRVLSEFSSGTDAKNFILCAVLYYCRSPLVLSANALTSALQEADGRFTSIIERLVNIENIIETLGVTGPTSDGFGSVTSVAIPSDVASSRLDPSVVSGLSSLKQKFRV